MWFPWILFRFFSSLSFLFLIIWTVPVSFDVGGKDCGLAFTLALVIFYFLFSTLRIVATDTGSKILVRVIGFFQYLIVPSILIFLLDRFSPETVSSPHTWTQILTTEVWDRFLQYSTPVFQLTEGFCTLLVIQSVGQISRWVANNRSDSWLLGLLMFSGSLISTSLYFLWRIFQFPAIGNVDATLIGIAITAAFFLGAYGIGSGKGNAIESSLLFSYVVLCMYQLFTDFKPTNPPPSGSQAMPDLPPFPPIIMDSYAQLAASLTYFLPITIKQTFAFIAAALSAITPSVIISLAYRLFVFYSATRIIPAVRERGARGIEHEPSIDDDEPSSRLMLFFISYSPCVFVAMYTHLLMQHTAMLDLGTTKIAIFEFQTPMGGQVWKWVNVALTMALYAFELFLGDENGDPLTSHWKTD